MKYLSTSSGKLFSASIEGSQPTIKDYMVAGHVYLSSLEDRFDNSQQLIACYRAWKQNEEEQPGDMTDDQLRRAKQWRNAHDDANRIAKKWLSNPNAQSFAIKVMAN